MTHYFQSIAYRKAFLIFAVLFSPIAQAQTLKIPIDKNKVAGSYSIEFEQPKLHFQSNEMFTLSENNLEANKTGAKGIKSTDNIEVAIKMFRKNKFINYPIKIWRKGDAKPYYGKIAFFNTNRKNELSAVARYRELAIPESYFVSASRGRIAVLYEYAHQKSGFSRKGGELPTWIIIMSDEPL